MRTKAFHEESFKSTDKLAQQRIASEKFDTSSKTKYATVSSIQIQGDNLWAMCRTLSSADEKGKILGYESTDILEEDLTVAEAFIKCDILAFEPMPGGYKSFLGKLVRVEYRHGRPYKVLLREEVEQTGSRVIKPLDLILARSTNKDKSLTHPSAIRNLESKYDKELVHKVLNETLKEADLDGGIVSFGAAEWGASSDDSIGENKVAKDPSIATGLPTKKLKGRTCHYHAKGLAG